MRKVELRYNRIVKSLILLTSSINRPECVNKFGKTRKKNFSSWNIEILIICSICSVPNKRISIYTNNWSIFYFTMNEWMKWINECMNNFNFFFFINNVINIRLKKNSFNNQNQITPNSVCDEPILPFFRYQSGLLITTLYSGSILVYTYTMAGPIIQFWSTLLFSQHIFYLNHSCLLAFPVWK